MSHVGKKPSSGSLKISQEVLATIARVAALEVEGVDSLATPTGAVRRFFPKGMSKEPIRIDLRDDFAVVSIALNLSFGVRISEACTAVQQSIKDNIQTMTGMAVSKVNVTVAGIVFPEPQASGQ